MLFRSTLELLDAQAGVNLLVEATGSQLALSTTGERGVGQPPRQLWSEPRAGCILELTRPFTAAGEFADRVDIDRLAVESSTVAVAARGGVGEWSTRRLVALDGSVSYDWQQLSRLLTPWTGGRLAVAGSGGRPFAFRGPIGQPQVASRGESPGGTGEPPTAVSLPQDWVQSARGAAAGEAAARLTSTTPAPAAGLAEQLRGFSVDTSAAWTAAELDGIPIAHKDIYNTAGNPTRTLQEWLSNKPYRMLRPRDYDPTAASVLFSQITTALEIIAVRPKNLPAD